MCAACKSDISSFYSLREKAKRTESVLIAALKPAAAAVEVASTIVEDEAVAEDGAQEEEPAIQEQQAAIIIIEKPISAEKAVESVEAVAVAGGDSTRPTPVTFHKTTNELLPTKQEVSDNEDDDYLDSALVDDEIDYSKEQPYDDNVVMENNVDDEEPAVADEEDNYENLMVLNADEDNCEDENDVDDIDDKYFCDICDLDFLHLLQFEEHLKLHDDDDHVEKIQQRVCELCSAIFDSRAEMESHFKETHAAADGAEIFNEYRVKYVDEEFRCSLCDKRMRSRVQLNMHENVHIINNCLDFFPCQRCRIIYLSEEKLAEHLSTFHDEQQPPQSSAAAAAPDADDNQSCIDYQFLDEDAYDESAAYSCGICQTTYSNAAEAKLHIVSHQGTFICPYTTCGSVYNNFMRYTTHIINKHSDDFLCSHCGQKFGSFDLLQSHIRHGCTEKKFACTTHCNKKFYSQKALKLHLRTTAGKQFSCEFCEKRFSQRGELTIHSRVHTGERPYACAICGKQYRTASMRSSHMDTHIEGKTFEV